jgi:hypothetical protein
MIWPIVFCKGYGGYAPERNYENPNGGLHSFYIAYDLNLKDIN